MLSKIGAITVLARTIAYETEMTVSALKGPDPVNKRYAVEGCVTGDRIKALAQISSSLPPSEFRNLIAMWCQAAEPAFTCWNSIVHTITLDAHSEWARSVKHLRRHGAMCKRGASGFHVSEHSLALMEQVFAVLYRVLVTIEWIVRQRNMEVAENTAKTLLSALREAKSASRVFEDLAATPPD
jgi:hypothetical protein